MVWVLGSAMQRRVIETGERIYERNNIVLNASFIASLFHGGRVQQNVVTLFIHLKYGQSTADGVRAPPRSTSFYIAWCWKFTGFSGVCIFAESEKERDPFTGKKSALTCQWIPYTVLPSSPPTPRARLQCVMMQYFLFNLGKEPLNWPHAPWSLHVSSLTSATVASAQIFPPYKKPGWYKKGEKQEVASSWGLEVFIYGQDYCG